MKIWIERLQHWERWPFKLLYFPLSFVWLWYCIRSRSLWFFSASNPTITFGGFEGECKREMYEQLPEDLYPATCYISPDDSFEIIREKVDRSGIRYPLVVKPDVGMKGLLFRKIESPGGLKSYHSAMQVDYLVQEMISLPIEVSVFYYRFPNQNKGVITGFIRKEYLEVTGNGHSSLLELIENHRRAKFRVEELRQRHQNFLHQIIPKGKIYVLSYAGNHNRGARFIDLGHQIDERLHRVFDTISDKARHFYYGRYDIKCNSLDELKQGKNFYILEFNGCGAEPNHIYDCDMSLWEAYREILLHWKVLYRISRLNHRNGAPYWSFGKGFVFLWQARRYFKWIEQLDTGF